MERDLAGGQGRLRLRLGGARLTVAPRQRARAGGKSLNEVAVEALTEAAGSAGRPHKRRDLADIAGTWKADKAIQSALADQDLVEEAPAVRMAGTRARIRWR
jgi:hypothetical protein